MSENDEDFYEDYNLVDDEDIENAAKKPKSKEPMNISPIKKGSSYESVELNDEVEIDEIIPEEVPDSNEKENFYVEYEIIDDKKNDEKKESLPVYIGFTPRLIVTTALVPILSIFTILFLYNSFSVDDIPNIRYIEKSFVNYQVLNNGENVTKEDNTYQKDVLDKINLDISYQYKVNKNSNLHFNYKVVGDLYVVDKDNNENILFHTTDTIVEDHNDDIINKQKYNIRENIEIDYKDYNSRAITLKESNNNSICYLEIKLITNYKSLNNNYYRLNDQSTTSFKIPLAEETVLVEYNNLDNEKRVNKRPPVKVESPGLLGLGILLGLGAVISLAKALLLITPFITEKPIYDKTVEKILRRHKKRIVKVDKVSRIRKKTTIEDINDLVRISKKVKQPIKYCVINEHNKCQFFVEYEKESFILTIKAVDLEKKD